MLQYRKRAELMSMMLTQGQIRLKAAVRKETAESWPAAEVLSWLHISTGMQ
jgi:hypothetical protein